MNLLTPAQIVANRKLAETNYSALRSVFPSGLLLKFCSASLLCLQRFGSDLNPNTTTEKIPVFVSYAGSFSPACRCCL